VSGPPLAPVAEHVPAGIVHVALPTPFPVGPVNCYVLLDDPVTVVDPGMLWADSTDQLEAALAGAGRSIGDVDQVVITYGHPDHFGAAGWLAEVGDAAVVSAAPRVPSLPARPNGRHCRRRWVRISTPALNVPAATQASWR